MTQENKDLLLKDLCARLPYGVKVKLGDNPNIFDLEYRIKFAVMYGDSDKLEDILDITNIKPYLFPLSSITNEQEKELLKLGVSYGEYALHDDIRGLGIMVDEAYIFFEFCYKHHIDFLDLIEMGLAIDATGKNIY